MPTTRLVSVTVPADRLAAVDAKDRREPSEIMETASAIGGALAGTAMTLLAGPFVGSASGEAVARVLLRVGFEVERRFLTPRQESRLGEAYAAAAQGIAAHLDASEKARSDGFFEQPGPEQSSPADELLEGVLRTAADAWEQRKVPYLGRIFANLCFDTSVSPADASYLLRVADRLTYRQVTVLAFWQAVLDADRPYGHELRGMFVVAHAEGWPQPTATILAEINDLASLGLLGVRRKGDGEVVHPGMTIGGLEAFGTFGGVSITTIQPTDMGNTLHRLMGLDEVPDDDLNEVLAAMGGISQRPAPEQR
jgi:hypothetical protein